MTNNLVTFAELGRVDFNGEPVLTTAQLAKAYETSAKSISANFKNNEERFVEGKHFFKLSGDALRSFKSESNDLGFAENLNVLYLWTKRGAARHAKILSTNVAWDVFEALEDNYFNRAEDKPIDKIADFKRGVELAKLAPHAKDPFAQKRIVAKAANLILGENFLPVPDYPNQISLFDR